jgi:hypothetical protein
MTPTAETIAVDRALLEHLIAKGRITSSDALKLSPELNQLASAMIFNERKNEVIEHAVGSIELDASHLKPLYQFARDFSWLSDDTPPNLHTAMTTAETLLLALGRGES